MISTTYLLFKLTYNLSNAAVGRGLSHITMCKFGSLVFFIFLSAYLNVEGSTKFIDHAEELPTRWKNVTPSTRLYQVTQNVPEGICIIPSVGEQDHMRGCRPRSRQGVGFQKNMEIQYVCVFVSVMHHVHIVFGLHSVTRRQV